jgi:hypothetical protein
MADIQAIETSAVFASPHTTLPSRLLGAMMAAGLGLAGCTLVRPVPPEAPIGQVVVAPGLTFALPRPAALGRPVEAAQLVTARYKHTTFVFETRISVTHARVLVAGTDMLGRRAMTIEWTGDDLKVEAAPWVPAELRAGNVIADIMLLHWPASAVRAALSSGGSLREPSTGHREIAANGTGMISIDRTAGAPGSWTGRWTYSNLAWGYGLEIQSTESAP